MATFLNGIPVCPSCKTPIRFWGVEERPTGTKEIYKCKCGLCDEERPVIKNKL
jgi:ligand-binding sensor protein